MTPPPPPPTPPPAEPGLRARDALRLRSTATMIAVRERDMVELAGGPVAYAGMTRLRKLHAIRRALDEGIVRPTQIARGENKVLLQGITKSLEVFQKGATYEFTHVDIGTDGTAPAEDQTGTLAHVDASATQVRLPITEKTLDGKILRTSSFIASSEYNGSTLREACLCDKATGGTPYNRVLFTTPLSKVNTDTAVCNIDHEKTN